MGGELASAVSMQAKQPGPFGEIKVAILLAVVIFGAFFHLAWSRFEHLSHYSRQPPDQRVLLLFSENAFYYSFYRDMVDASSAWQAAAGLLSNGDIEYPEVVNILRRLNIFPEMAVAAAQRALAIAGIETDPFHLYLNAVFGLYAVGAGALFLLGSRISGTLAGGLPVILLYGTNWFETARPWAHPALRENFAIPFFYIQLYLLVLVILRRRDAAGSEVVTQPGVLSHWSSRLLPVFFVMACVLMLLCWQFAHFLLFTQVVALYMAMWLGALSLETLYRLTRYYLISSVLTLLLQLGNTIVLDSLLLQVSLGLLFTHLLTKRHRAFAGRLVNTLTVVALALAARWITQALLGSDDTGHVFAVLGSRLGWVEGTDLNTLLYTTQAAFSTLPWSWIGKLTGSALLPLAGVTMVLTVYRATRDLALSQGAAALQNKLSAGSNWAVPVYLVVQFVQLACMALAMMRFVALAVPFTCLMVSLLLDDRVLPLRRNTHNKPDSRAARRRAAAERDATTSRWLTLPPGMLRWMLAGGLTILVLYCGLDRVTSAFGTQEGGGQQARRLRQSVPLIEWIRKNTPLDAVFTADMVTTSLIRLGTRRRITFHPQYERASTRERAYAVYRMYGRVPAGEIHDGLAALQSDYAVISQARCRGRVGSGQRFVDIIDAGLGLSDSTVPRTLCEPSLWAESEASRYFELAWSSPAWSVYRIK